MAEFDGKTVLITGGGSGLGFATARRLVDAGANVVLAGRRADMLQAAAKELDPAGDQALAVCTDVSQLDELDDLIGRIRDHFGVLDGVFANAGVSLAMSTPKPLTEADFGRMVDINFKGTFFTIHKAVPLLCAGGSVVVNSTWIAHRGMGMPVGVGSVYAATKAAVSNLARSFAADLASQQIRVNAVSPGFIQTDMLDELAYTEAMREQCRALPPIGRIGQPEEIADTVTFLLSPRAAYITGQDLAVDGGLVSSAAMSAPVLE